MELINKSEVINITAETGALETQSRVRDMQAVISIPDNATNGDVIKAVFPKIPRTLLFHIENHMGQDWWNAPYKGGKE